MYTPGATYRIQLHHQYKLQQLKEIIGYLHDLGITTIYASPITAAGKESMHGYDVTDPCTINPEIGSEDELREVVRLAAEKGMGWLQDIVPNHMAFSSENERLMDVLERGTLSRYHRYFDIDWEHPDSKGKLMVPFLGETLQEAIEKGNIRIILTKEGFKVAYYQQEYPLSLSAYQSLLSMIIILAKGKTHPGALNMLLTEGMQGEKLNAWRKHKTSVFTRLVNNERSRTQIEGWLTTINQDAKWLVPLLDTQYYQLCHYKEVDKTINYRRFFTVSSLICLRMEADDVYPDYHQLFSRLYRQGLIQGVRIDHIDGLYDPGEYIKKLRRVMGPACYIVAEKILEGNETIPAGWPLQGTTGYEFLAALSQLLTNRQGGARLLQYYHQLLGGGQSYSRQVMKNKKYILQRYMQGECDNLVRLFHQLGLAPHAGQWKEALMALIAAWPVYRLYPTEQPWTPSDKELIEEAFAHAKEQEPGCGKELEHLHQLFHREQEQTGREASVLRLLKRMMQFTGPAMAKGVEDTTFYTYNPLIAHNEVGDSPDVLGDTVGQFHEKMKARQAATPLSLNASATHDTKRGEDARVRLIVLSEMPEIWEQEATEWFHINEGSRSKIDDKPVPTINEEYFIYQSVIGGYPEDEVITDEYIERLQQYITKAIREAKANTSWDEPHQAYEQACMDFITKLFQKDHGFLQRLQAFMKQVNQKAHIHSLSQLLIKVTAPGIPDIYQGCELWDLSYVDPDNRRPVNYSTRIQYLQQIKEQEQQGANSLFPWLKDHRAAGMEKLFLCYKALHFRKEHQELFTQGEYIPLHVESGQAAVAYARQWGQQWVIVVLPLSGSEESKQSGTVVLPEGVPAEWINVLSGKDIATETYPEQRRLSLAALWKQFPVAMIYGSSQA